MKKVKFVFAVHNHQPVGNFKWVFQKGYDISYRPFIDVMMKHPSIKWNMHCSGMLWDFFAKEHPSYIDCVKSLIKAGTLEIISGGYYEPMLSVIPGQDRNGQIRQLSDFIKDTLKYDCTGAWIAERVWEPSLATDLASAGIKYTVLDDVHFTASGVDTKNLNGYFTTEDQGNTLNVFPISQKMRYLVPFQDVGQTIDYFRQLANEDKENVIVLADDGEKFGMWPGTYKHVYEYGWLDRFLTALEENSDIVETVTFKEVLDTVKPTGRIYLPTNSYFEMSEWTLPADAQTDFEALEKQNSNDANKKRFVRGGFWRLFLSKYPEANNMHKKMLHISKKLKEYSSKKKIEKYAKQYLYAGQCNCAYWHGVFGGLYLPHLRNAVYANLLKAERIYNDVVGAENKWTKTDFDCDGTDEFLYESEMQNIYVDTENGGSIFEFDVLKNSYNFSNILNRRYEGYHKKLTDAIQNNNIADGQNGVATIHSDAVKVKETGLENHLYYDWYKKGSLVDHFFHADTNYSELYPVRFKEQGDFVLGTYNAKIVKNSLELSRSGNVWFDGKHLPLKVKKILTPLKKESGYEVSYTIKNESDVNIAFKFGVEQVFAFSENTADDNAEIKNVKSWTRQDALLGTSVNVDSSQQCDYWIVPINTVSVSEDGYEKTYQGTTAVNVYNVELNAGAEFSFKIKTQIKSIKK